MEKAEARNDMIISYAELLWYGNCMLVLAGFVPGLLTSSTTVVVKPLCSR
jgi:hypothetical protein